MKDIKSTLAIVLVIFNAVLFWLAWTGDKALHAKDVEKLTKKIEEVNMRCDSLNSVLSTVSYFKSDTIIVNVPQPMVKVIYKTK